MRVEATLLLMKMTRTRTTRLRLADWFFPKVIKRWSCLSSPNISETRYHRKGEKSRLILFGVKVIAIF